MRLETFVVEERLKKICAKKWVYVTLRLVHSTRWNSTETSKKISKCTINENNFIRRLLVTFIFIGKHSGLTNSVSPIYSNSDILLEAVIDRARHWQLTRIHAENRLQHALLPYTKATMQIEPSHYIWLTRQSKTNSTICAGLNYIPI